MAQYEHLISEVRLSVDWTTEIEFKIDDKKFVNINIYTSFKSIDNESNFLREYVIAFAVNELDTTSVVIVGDWNTEISDHV